MQTNAHSLSQTQKRDLVASVLTSNPEKSDRTIAFMTNVGRDRVSIIRAELETREEIRRQDKRVGANGVAQSSTKQWAQRAPRRVDQLLHIRPADECVEWIGLLSLDGYGRVRHNRRQIPAHRASFELNVGPIPDGLWVLHRCDNRKCINPRHLFLGDHRANMADMVAKGRGRAKNSGQTHCLRGHEFTVSNTHTYRGHRICRACRAAKERRRRAAMPPEQRKREVEAFLARMAAKRQPVPA